MTDQVLDGQIFTKLVSGGAANLQANAEIVNELNVFPIPDGDTGENMSLTIGGGLRNLQGKDETSIGKAAKLLADGMLMSARGNSGVILSQLFAGIAESLAEKETATVEDLAEALRAGVKSAYAAVINPTEGTILTVAREAADYAAARVGEGATFQSFSSDYIAELKRSLDRTPELLQTLKEAGVIDSGGAGLYYIAEGVIRTANGEEPQKNDLPKAPAAELDLSKFGPESVMEFGYCTEFLLRLQTSKTDLSAFSVDDFIVELQTLGDSIVCFRNDTIVKVHIHTMTPGVVLNHCQKYGEFLTLKIENMTLQHSETEIRNRFQNQKSEAQKDFALVTVATGEGIRQTFSELGADFVIDGGQGKNPSTEDFISAFDSVNARVIFVLPNNGNIVMAAKQAASLYQKSEVYVVESKNIGEGYAALTMLSYDSGNAEIIAADLREAMQGVVTGMVTHSIRNATIDGVSITQGEYIGFTDKTMLSSGATNTETALALLEKLNAESHDFLIAIYGKDMTDAQRETFRVSFAARYPSAELYEIDGGQEIYDFLLILQ
ncbi:MAG: DAK2 domain-containing protein [Ruminococcaceae bacterium]|nr:DAK2 domain-containing protein [Oscillospiraceae bacterium]